MTSTEFAAKYRLLKNVATRGARTFLAQQVALGRMVMVHYIDAEPDVERGDPVARLRALTGAARNKLLEILDVDGSPVAVTLFISSFVDFSTWLDQAAAPTPASSNPRESGEAEITAPRRPISRAPDVEPAPAPASRGEFTQMFGKLDFDAELRSSESGTHRSTPAAPALPPDVPDFAGDSATLIMEQPKAPVAADLRMTPPPTPAPVAPPPPTPASPPPAVRAEEPGDASFTAIFGTSPVQKGAAPFPVDPPRGLASPAMSAAPLPSFSAPSAPERVMPFPAPFPAPLPERPAPVPIAPRAPEPPAGEFTQLFQRLNTSAPAAPPAAPEPLRPLDPMPPADVSSAPPAPRFAMQPPPPMPSAPPAPAMPPAFGAEPPRAPNVAWGGPTIPTESAPSDYTRILGRISPLPEPNQPPVAMAPNAAAPEAKPAAAAQPPSAAKSYLPLILALNAVAIATAAIVLYFVLKK